MKPTESTAVRLARFLLRTDLPRERKTYFNAMLAVFPAKDYPRAWRYSSNGGPPGCAMAFGSALRALKVTRDSVGSSAALYWSDEACRALLATRATS